MMKTLPGTPYINMFSQRNDGTLVLHDRFYHDLAIFLTKHADQWDRIADSLSHLIGGDKHPNAHLLWSAARSKASALRKLIHEMDTPITQAVFCESELSLMQYLREESIPSVQPIYDIGGES